MDFNMLISLAVVFMLGVSVRKLFFQWKGKKAAEKPPAASVQKSTSSKPHMIHDRGGKYTVLTEEALAALPDEKLLEAVILNLQAKMDDQLSDMFPVLGALSPERQAIYLSYAVTHAVKEGGFSVMVNQAEGPKFLSVCITALQQIGLKRAAGAISQALKAKDPDRYQVFYLQSFNREKGSRKMAQYIRQNAAAFCDETPQKDG